MFIENFLVPVVTADTWSDDTHALCCAILTDPEVARAFELDPGAASDFLGFVLPQPPYRAVPRIQLTSFGT